MRKTVFSAFIILTVFVLILSSCGVNYTKTSIGSVNDMTVSGSDLRSLSKRASTKVASNETSELYFDKNSGAVTFYDRSGSRNWNSLPSFRNDFAAPFIIEVFDGKNLLILDSIRHCAEKDGITHKISGNTVEAEYKFTEGDISVVLPVSFSLEGAYFTVSADMEKCQVSENAVLISVSVLPFMGSVRYTDENFDVNSLGDWFLVPDGAGAIIYMAAEDENFTEASYNVYGKEYYGGCVPADIGAFGIRQGSCALSATLCEGSENAVIKVFRPNADDKEINRIYPEFVITPIEHKEGKTNMGSSYRGKISVKYETLSGDNADYIGVASSVRQALISENMMPSDKKVQAFPFYVTLVTSVDGKKDGVLTSFPQSENLLNMLKGKGVDEISLLLEGMLSGGMGQKSAASADIISAAGGKKEFAELCNYADSQQIDVFSGVKLFSASSGSALRILSGIKFSYDVINPFYPYISQKSFGMNFLDNKSVSDAVNGVIDTFADINCSVAVTDAQELIVDFTSENSSFSSASSFYRNAVGAVGASKAVMLSGVRGDLLSFADRFVNVDFSTYYPASQGYTAVPFIPAVLHSVYSYAPEAVNLSDISTFSLLKSVEYGACVHYQWCFYDRAAYYYENTLSEAVDFYIEAEKELGDLQTEKITEHYVYEDGVACTEYSNGSKVYVNYNNYSVRIGNVAVMPYDYLRIG